MFDLYLEKGIARIACSSVIDRASDWLLQLKNSRAILSQQIKWNHSTKNPNKIELKR